MFRFLLLFFVFVPSILSANPKHIHFSAANINQFVDESIRDAYKYTGLAAFYNKISLYEVDGSDVVEIPENQLYQLNINASLAIVGRYDILLVSDYINQVHFNEDLINIKTDGDDLLNAMILKKSELDGNLSELSAFRYSHLWMPLKYICLFTYKFFYFLNTIHGFGWGITIIIFSLCFKLLMLPLTFYQTVIQRKVQAVTNSLELELIHIKSTYMGQEAHERYMAAHKKLGVTPFFSLKPILFTILQVPFLIAIFNVLGELDQLNNVSFLWIEDLSRPDSIYEFSRGVPLLGNTFNLLPIIMTIVCLLGAFFSNDPTRNEATNKKRRLKVAAMAFLFFVLFYPFPSALVLYWTCVNALYLVQLKLLDLEALAKNEV
ncbi:YidC/Oxa1 family membrane protein insertase [Endozoicomonas lisbonensis]|uniref:YidC/Oxa1 family membrane protein insertase n=1 Tax=Endozoicomonas lisbonensis TaxID=3120522 RepID=A0ABV2SMM2_9GAMM